MDFDRAMKIAEVADTSEDLDLPDLIEAICVLRDHIKNTQGQAGAPSDQLVSPRT